MRLFTAEELKAMSVEKATEYFEKMHKAHEKLIVNE